LLQQEAETGLNILPAARLTNPWGHLFGQKGPEPLLAEWRLHFDLVVLDCPPVLANAESAILARFADANLLTVSWDDTSGAEIRAATRRLRQHRVKGLRMHMNRAPDSILSQVRERS
jgi:Mrp family chromosome partitioning ATPase